MYSLLKRDALKNIWCERQQDYQLMFKPARLTRAGGTTRYVNINNERVALPNADNVLDKRIFHVYHLGRRFDNDFNFTIEKKWVSLESIANTSNIVFDIFFDNGSRYPLSRCYIKRLDNNDIILAVVIKSIDLGIESFYDETLNGNSTRPVNLDTSTLYYRSYANARYDSLDWLAINGIKDKSIVYNTVEITNENDYVSFMAFANQTENSYTFGRAIYYKEGFVISKPMGFETGFIGKVFSFYYDQSIKKIEMFTVNTLPTFISQLDISRTKYGLVTTGPYDMIDYLDDIDVYLIDVTTGSAFIGCLLPRFDTKVIRQLTHTAYALDKITIDDLIERHGFLNSTTRVMLVVREGGMKTGLIPHHSRFQDLYKLSHTQIIEAMSSNSLVPEWLFHNLESSSYTKIMGLSVNDITEELVEDAYGYNSALKTVMNPYLRTMSSSGHHFVTLPDGLTIPDVISNAGKRAVFTYYQGKLKGYYSDLTLFKDIMVQSSVGPVDSVEVFNMEISPTTDGIIYNSDVTNPYLKQYGFRTYVCPMVGGIPNEEWEDVTDNIYYDYSEGDSTNGYVPRLLWNWGLLAQANLYPCVKMNHIMFVKEVNGLGSNYPGYIRLPLESMNNWLGSAQLTPQHIPHGVIDVFMDGHPLVENVDHYIKWPFVTIVKRPLTDPLLTKIVIRAYGPCNPATLLNYPARDIGFTKKGIVSDNHRYDIRADRCIRVIADGLLQDPNQVWFAEGNSGNLIRDGKPYAVMDYVLPVENFTGKRTVPYRNESLDLDERVMDYLTPLIPVPTAQHPVVAEWRWNVISPFCSAAIHLLLDGFLNTGVLDNPYTKAQTDVWLSSILHLLDVDPCVRGVDSNYISISPHQYDNYIVLTFSQYRFIEFIVSNYLNNKVDPTLALRIG